MNQSTQKMILAVMICTMATGIVKAQQLKDGKLWLNETGSHYFKATLLTQVWLRNTQMNPGTTIDGFAKDNYTDIGIRRGRMQAFGKVSDRVFIYSQVGINNFNFLSDRKAGFFIHDLNADYEILHNYLAVGGGLTAWNGLSRYSAPSAGTIMGIDAPLFEQNTNDITDQFLRKLSLYAKGKWNRFDYRMVMSSPMSITKSAGYVPTLTTHSTYSPKPAKMQWHGYFQWQFLDQESNTTAYNTGTYLGTKRVLNIGAGFQYQPDALWHLRGADTIQTAMKNLAVDVYYDAPAGKDGAAISAYGVYMSSDYGPGYLRNLAVMNPANGSSAPTILNGGGNGYPSFGTGDLLYGQIGYKFKNNFAGKTTFMPYVSMQYASYDRLEDKMIFWDAGINWLLQGHMAKLTLACQNRPVFQAGMGNKAVETGRRSSFLLQYQVRLN
jgi:hypothetical protein